MRSDALLAFVPLGSALSLVAGTGVSIPSPITFDALGQGVGTAPVNIIGSATVFGTDFGVGDDRPLLNVVIGTALATATSATLNVAFQGAVDPGAGGNYTPTTWQTLVETGPLTAAQCTANTRVARFDWPPAFPETMAAAPRFFRLLFQIPASTNFTAGTCAFALVTTARDDQANRNAARNFAVF